MNVLVFFDILAISISFSSIIHQRFNIVRISIRNVFQFDILIDWFWRLPMA